MISICPASVKSDDEEEEEDDENEMRKTMRLTTDQILKAGIKMGIVQKYAV